MNIPGTLQHHSLIICRLAVLRPVPVVPPPVPVPADVTVEVLLDVDVALAHRLERFDELTALTY